MATNHLVRMTGHGVDLTVPGFSGFPTYCTAPGELQRALEQAYRAVVVDWTGGLSTTTRMRRASSTKQPLPGLFVTAQAVEFSLYKLGSDGTARRDDSTRRVFRLYTTHDYR